MTGAQVVMLETSMIRLFTEVRPDAVALVDAFDFPDKVLESCIGSYDGNVYERLMEFTKQSPLNKTEVRILISNKSLIYVSKLLTAFNRTKM